MMWGNYCGTPAHTVTIIDGIRHKLPVTEIIYDKGCDFVDNQVMYSYYDQCAINSKKGFKAEFWNNRDMEGDPIANGVYDNPLNFTTLGGTHFTPGVELRDFYSI